MKPTLRSISILPLLTLVTMALSLTPEALAGTRRVATAAADPSSYASVFSDLSTVGSPSPLGPDSKAVLFSSVGGISSGTLVGNTAYCASGRPPSVTTTTQVGLSALRSFASVIAGLTGLGPDAAKHFACAYVSAVDSTPAGIAARAATAAAAYQLVITVSSLAGQSQLAATLEGGVVATENSTDTDTSAAALRAAAAVVSQAIADAQTYVAAAAAASLTISMEVAIYNSLLADATTAVQFVDNPHVVQKTCYVDPGTGYFSQVVSTNMLATETCLTYGQSIVGTQPRPTLSLATGTYPSAQSVTISSWGPEASIYYTLDNSTPTASSMLYTGAIVVSASKTINAIAVANGYSNSDVASASYTITSQPTISLSLPLSGTTVTGFHMYSNSVVGSVSSGSVVPRFTPSGTCSVAGATVSIAITDSATPSHTFTTTTPCRAEGNVFGTAVNLGTVTPTLSNGTMTIKASMTTAGVTVNSSNVSFTLARAAVQAAPDTSTLVLPNFITGISLLPAALSFVHDNDHLYVSSTSNIYGLGVRSAIFIPGQAYSITFAKRDPVTGTTTTHTASFLVTTLQSQTAPTADATNAAVFNIQNLLVDNQSLLTDTKNSYAANFSLGDTAAIHLVSTPKVTIATLPATVNSTNVGALSASGISGTCTEPGTSIDSSTVTLTASSSGGGQPLVALATCAAGTWVANPDLSSLSEGTVTLTANVTDAAGTAAIPATASFVLDVTPPTLTLSADGLTDGQIVNLFNRTVTLTVTQTKYGSPYISHSWASITFNGIIAPSLDWNTPQTYANNPTFNAGGDITITASTVDDDGNPASASITLRNVTNAPLITMGSDVTTGVATQLQATAAADDLGGTISNPLSYQWSQIEGPGIVSFSDPTLPNPTVSADVNGTYRLALAVTDSVGNVGGSSMNFTWTDTSPAD